MKRRGPKLMAGTRGKGDPSIMAEEEMVDREKKILQTVDNEPLAWDICEDFIARDRDIFGKDSPHTFGVMPLYTWPNWTYAVYLKVNVRNEEEPEVPPNLRYSSRGPR